MAWQGVNTCRTLHLPWRKRYYRHASNCHDLSSGRVLQQAEQLVITSLGRSVSLDK